MRIAHFETLKPVCPRCKAGNQIIAPLVINNVAHQVDDIIIDGNLMCSNQQCRLEYPIIDGIPVIVNNLRKYLNDNFYHLTVRNDLSEITKSILGDAAGPGAAFNSMRHYLSTYAWDHYGDKAPENEFMDQQQQVKPGSVVSCLNAGLSLFMEKPAAPMLDISCAAGRSTFELAAKFDGQALGIDLNFSLLRIAQNLLQKSTLTFPLKKIGIIYERHRYEVALEKKQKVDFWACDALALPFKDETFGFVSALNVLDTVTSPVNLLQSINSALTRGGGTVLATTYDWSSPAPVHNWIGGHAQRGSEGGNSEQLLRNLLTPDKHPQAAGKLSLIGEIEHHPWHVRIH
ncbi:MAG: methyltransferase domain-containing protein, partial [Gammaproteobacteria bacterium]|nr:methyltransferase domain-containing protein [Gammaproteobacteria bacterium]